MDEREQIVTAIAALEAQRALLGDAVVETALGPLRAKLAVLDAPATEQRKHVTILFADVQGFTALSESLDPEDVSQLMNLGWQKLDGVIRAHGGWIDKHIGDAVMALWGVEQAHENDAERAVRAALAMQTAIREWQQELHAAPMAALTYSLIENLQIRIGLHTGPVVLSQVGSKNEYTALGDSVNVASRLEHAAPPGGILISHATYEHVRGLFEVEPQAPLSVKGKTDPLRTYLVKRAQPRAFWVERRGVEGARAALIGREAELTQLHQLRAALHTEPGWRAAALVGEAGMGKSRLLFEFENQLQGEFNLRARADESLQMLPLSLVRDLYVGWFDIREDDAPQVVRSKVEKGVSLYLGAQSTAQAHLIGQMVGFDFAHSPYVQPFLPDLTYLRQRAFQAERELFQALCQRAPVVLMLEDLHWADDMSLEWLADLARRARQLPLLLVGTTRPALWRDHPHWHTPIVRVALTPLTEVQSQQLADELVPGARQLPPEVVAQALAQAEGNPYYLEELLKMLLEAGPQAGQIPSTLAGVLQARLERLQVEEQNVLQRSAVVGRVFWNEAVAQLNADPEDTAAQLGLTKVLRALQERELVFQNPEAAFAEVEEYWFKHALLREVAYDRVLKSQRPSYHRRAAEWLIARSHERVNEYAGVIADHYERAGETALAAHWHAQAGQAAYATYAVETAIRHCHKALELWGEAADPRLQFEVLDVLGNALSHKASWAEAVAAHQHSLRVAQQLNDPRLQLRAYEGLVLIQADQQQSQATLELGTQVEQLARQHSAQIGPTRLARALYLRGVTLPITRLTEVVALAEEGAYLAAQAQDLARQADHLHLLGNAYLILGKLHLALQAFEKSLKIWQSLGHKLYEARLFTTIGETLRFSGDYVLALSWYQAAAEQAQAIEAIGDDLMAQANIGLTWVGRKDYAKAEQILVTCISNPLLAMMTEANLHLALIYCHQHQTAQAQAALTAAVAASADESRLELEGLKWRVAGQIVAQAGQPLELTLELTQVAQLYSAEVCFAKAVEIFESYQQARDLAVALGEWARYAHRQGNVTQATALRARARTIFEELDLPLLLAEMEAE